MRGARSFTALRIVSPAGSRKPEMLRRRRCHSDLPGARLGNENRARERSRCWRRRLERARNQRPELILGDGTLRRTWRLVRPGRSGPSNPFGVGDTRRARKNPTGEAGRNRREVGRSQSGSICGVFRVLFGGWEPRGFLGSCFATPNDRLAQRGLKALRMPPSGEAAARSTSRIAPPILVRLGAPENVLHGPTFGQLVHQLVEVANLAHRGLFDVLDPDATNDACDQRAAWIHGRGLGEKGLEVHLFGQL